MIDRQWTALNGLGFAAAAALLLFSISAGKAVAEETELRHRPPAECRGAYRDCRHESRNSVRLCRSECAEGEVGQVCRDACRDSYREDKGVCRQELRECAQAHRPPLDEICAEDCRVEYAEIHDARQMCHADCTAAYREAAAQCRAIIDRASDPEGYRACMREARHDGRLCEQDCNDEFNTGGEFRQCLSMCVIED